jgi:hypothetical protein
MVIQVGLNRKITESPVVLFVGAGASCPLGFKTTSGFLELVKTKCENEPDFWPVFNNWMETSSPDKRDIEYLLNYLDKIQADKSIHVHALTNSFDVALRKLIVEHYSDVDAEKARFHYGWLTMLLKAYPQDLHPLPIFTTNYDWILDKALAGQKSIVNVVDGFRPTKLGTFWNEGTFSKFRGSRLGLDLVYFKLHGSTSWYLQPNGQILKTTHAELDPGRLKTLLVYPMSQKKPLDLMPFLTSYNYLRGCLSGGCQLCLVIGFSFRDTEICRVFAESLEANSSLKIILVDPNPADNIFSMLGLSYDSTRLKLITEYFRYYGLDDNKNLTNELISRMSSKSIFLSSASAGTVREQNGPHALLEAIRLKSNRKS